MAACSASNRFPNLDHTRFYLVPRFPRHHVALPFLRRLRLWLYGEPYLPNLPKSVAALALTLSRASKTLPRAGFNGVGDGGRWSVCGWSEPLLHVSSQPRCFNQDAGYLSENTSDEATGKIQCYRTTAARSDVLLTTANDSQTSDETTCISAYSIYTRCIAIAVCSRRSPDSNCCQPWVHIGPRPQEGRSWCSSCSSNRSPSSARFVPCIDAGLSGGLVLSRRSPASAIIYPDDKPP